MIRGVGVMLFLDIPSEVLRHFNAFILPFSYDKYNFLYSIAFIVIIHLNIS